MRSAAATGDPASDFGSVHQEVELAVLIGATLRQAMKSMSVKPRRVTAWRFDLIRAMFRENEESQAVEKAKAFDNSVRFSGLFRGGIHWRSRKQQRWPERNGEQRQQGTGLVT